MWTVNVYMFVAEIRRWAVLAVVVVAVACTSDSPNPRSTSVLISVPAATRQPPTELTSRACTIIQREGENFLIRIITPEEYFDKIIPALILIEEDLASGADLYVFGDKPLIYMFGRFLGDGVGPRHAELLQNACLAYR